ncbi:MAG: hypothetical protein EAZ37_06090 [Burkholderiales bacterium]|nr:MAG: hypothetical protein EAZ37_06090 [Burkholderiales bacterium]
MKFFLSALLALTLVFAAAAGALAWWLSGDGPRERVQALATEKLGVPVTLSKLSLSVFPWPSVAVSDLKIATQTPLAAERMELRPAWRKLLGLGGAARELEVESLTLRGLSLPQKGFDQISEALLKAERDGQQIRRVTAQKTLKTEEKMSESAAVIVGLLAIPQRTRLDGVVWISGAGESLSLSGDVSLNAARNQMDLNLQLAGGSVRGPLRLASKDGKTGWQLRGELATSGVELAQLPGARQRMAGRLQGTTTLDAQAAQLAGIGAALQTQTQFNVSNAVLKGVDLAKAVRTLGISRGGETALQELSGNLATRGSGAPMQIALSDLQAKSSILKASGAVSIGAAASPGAPRALNGKVDVDLTAGDGKVGQVVDKTVGQWVGIPLEIGGTTAAPTVAPTKGAMIGGAIGSVIAPVIGTGAGAKMGDKAAQKLGSLKERLFGK